jgi:hypothetical protein
MLLLRNEIYILMIRIVVDELAKYKSRFCGRQSETQQRDSLCSLTCLLSIYWIVF